MHNNKSVHPTSALIRLTRRIGGQSCGFSRYMKQKSPMHLLKKTSLSTPPHSGAVSQSLWREDNPSKDYSFAQLSNCERTINL